MQEMRLLALDKAAAEEVGVKVYCESTHCEDNKDGYCQRDEIELRHQMTGGGLVLMCEFDTDK